MVLVLDTGVLGLDNHNYIGTGTVVLGNTTEPIFLYDMKFYVMKL